MTNRPAHNGIDWLLLAACVVALAGCSADSFSLFTNAFGTDNNSGDPFPIKVSAGNGALLLGFEQVGSNTGPQPAVVDILAPISILIDDGTAVVRRRSVTGTLFGARAITGQLDVPRAEISTLMTNFLPCPGDCRVGRDGSSTIAAIIGADALGGDAIRLRFANSTMFVLPSIAPQDNGLAGSLCNAVFPSPFRGGGNLVLGNTEVSFPGRRIAINACAGPDTKANTQSARGTDFLLVASTGVGATLLSESAYLRYQAGHAGTPPISALPIGSVWLPSGQIQGRATTLTSLTLAANSSAGRGACREAYSHHLLFERETFCIEGDDCPCDLASPSSCGVPALLELKPPGGINVLVIADTEPTLQGLRTELRPDQAEVDGILGTDAMVTAEIDIDYPNNRLLARCVDASCRTRPTLAGATEGERAAIRQCILP
jgi:hypothetical protein